MLDTAIHKSVIVTLLKEIYTNMRIGPFLGFKGGTAAYLFYELDRFSVDLDFDLLDVSKEEEVFAVLQTILEEHGTIKEARKKRYPLFFLFSYRENFQSIKVEVNMRNFGSRYDVRSYLWHPYESDD